MAESSIDGAIVVTQTIKPGGLVSYAEYASGPKPGQSPDDRVLSVINDMGPETPAGLVASAVEMEKILDRTSRTNHGLDIVVSFSPKRFDPRNPAHVAEAREIVAETLRRGAPNTPHLAVLQGDNGVLHAHVILPNHDVSTGRARRRNWHSHHWRDINDQVLIEHGIEPIVPGHARQSEIERTSAARGLRIPDHDALVAKQPADITARELDAYLAAHINEAMIDGRLATLPEPGDATLLPIADGRHLSVRCGTKGGMSYAVTDADGTPAMTAPGKRGGKPQAIARSAGKLDRAHHTAADGDEKLYGREWLADQIAAMSAEQEMTDDRTNERRREAARLEDSARAELDRAARAAADDLPEHIGTTDTRTGAERLRERVIDRRDGRTAGVDQPHAADGHSGGPRGDRQRAEETPATESVPSVTAADELPPYDRRAAAVNVDMDHGQALGRISVNGTRADGKPRTAWDAAHDRAERRYVAAGGRMTPAEAMDAEMGAKLKDGRTLRATAGDEAKKRGLVTKRGTFGDFAGHMKQAQKNIAEASRRSAQSRSQSSGMSM